MHRNILEYFTNMVPHRFSDLDDVMTVEEMASYLKVTERHIYKLLSEQKLPAFKVGGTWRFRRTDLNTWINSELGNTSKGTKV